MPTKNAPQTTHLRADRLRRNRTQAAQAALIGITGQYLSRLEGGEVASPEVVRRIFAKLGVTPNQQYGIADKCRCKAKGRAGTR